MKIKGNIVKFYENKNKKPEVMNVEGSKTAILKEISNSISSNMENIKDIQIILKK